ncbi:MULTISPECIES: DUF4286 family protein [Croceibacter]|jgi:hypothetical protein|uniref:DUF4286 domain-containing protein n=1 Tax=Croceibacter atlanticus (strain ATCC BAA-628 / JCM 21780 / CIP 108009 / IAM 15332 / KCTC 12090 / HTCC2559) TaxID=216432 RepID=A3U6H5_CROAH|nr:MULTISPECIES: DUF4286 family protein [Croceibacter]HAT71159.1 DUF4286 domain-containing protein [Flavobacteriaceae bacterium]EAP87842.1 hypothetical protein CA2559_03765 [Croceibacter atlanticus HTCC2559]MAM23560.1 DUF4286 domain-containing protein [Croceibacter sp.]MBG25364.1 DUF4286 domain-containing protein [Croceibacter sp.]MBW4969928.1 DUF4286 family protein [Croceibacter atlanticus]|tara:strand:- start:3740 stop:4063 length:324 start_codon:yes stop_codon:yes gene_type:complete
MIIYNVTTNVEESAHNEWIQWMQKEHIPMMLDTKKFSRAIMSRVLVEEEMGGFTYSVQYFTEDKAMLDRYYSEDADRLRNESKRFAGKFVSFRTEMEVVGEAMAQAK